eukprot:7062310-Prorocentrum_lima.AAC.1
MLPELHVLIRPWGWVLENVANFGTLAQGKYAQALQIAFFDIDMRVWPKVLELNDILPLRRKRWVAL